MRIVIDIAHPAHVHYYRNFIKIMSSHGHEFLVTARNKEYVYQLLNSYDIPFVKRGSGKEGVLGTLRYALSSIRDIYRAASKFKPDLFLDMGTIFTAPVAKLLGKPYIAMDDTEASDKARFLHMPFTNHILTPSCFYKDLGKKHIRFNSYMELAYLAPKYFKPDPEILKLLGIRQNEKFIIVRFVSWEAHHDMGVKRLSTKDKFQIINSLKKNAKIFITSEKGLPLEFESYKIVLPPEKIHDALFYATLYFGEGATMASESSLLGTPAIYANNILNGYILDHQKNKLLFHSLDPKEIINVSSEIITNNNSRFNFLQQKRKILLQQIDLNKLLIWFIENYPESAKTMKENPDYQYRFK